MSETCFAAVPGAFPRFCTFLWRFLLPRAFPRVMHAREGPVLKRPAVAAAAGGELPVPEGMPKELSPPGKRGRLSYTVHWRAPEAAQAAEAPTGPQEIVLEVLLKARAFRTKVPRVVYVRWHDHEDLAAAWAATQAALARPPERAGDP